MRIQMILNKTRDRRDKVVPIGLALSGGVSSWLMVHLISTAVGKFTHGFVDASA